MHLNLMSEIFLPLLNQPSVIHKAMSFDLCRHPLKFVLNIFVTLYNVVWQHRILTE